MKRHLGAPIGAILYAMAFCLSGQAETEEKIHRDFSAKPGGKLVVDVDFGSIEVTTNQTEKIVVDIVRKVSRRKKADEAAFLKDRPVVFDASENTLSIHSRGVKKENIWSNLGSHHQDGRYSIQVPSEFEVDLRTAGGGVSVEGLEGQVKARTSGGGLEFSDVRGRVDGATSGGGIHARGCNGEMTVQTSGGRIHIRDGTGTLDARTSGGGMETKNFSGPVTMRTSGGRIDISNVKGSLDAATSGGAVKARLEALSDAVKLTTSGGSITFAAPQNATFDLDAATSAGRVESELPVSVVGKVERNHLKGTVNGGGKQVFLRTSGGNIDIERN